MFRNPLLPFFLLPVLLAGSAPQGPRLEKKWETRPLLQECRSVLYDAEHQMIYASCINGRPTKRDGNGYLSRVDLTGAILAVKWVTGLDAPKGMTIWRSNLVVVDIDRLIIINRDTGRTLQNLKVPEARFLTDAAACKDRFLFLSDTFGEKIFVFDGETVTPLPPHRKIISPSALAVQEDWLVVGSYRNDRVVALHCESHRVKFLFKGFLKTDGLVSLNDEGDWLVSELTGTVSKVRVKGDQVLLLDTRSRQINSGDIDYVPDKGILLVPTFFSDRVVAYEIHDE